MPVTRLGRASALALTLLATVGFADTAARADPAFARVSRVSVDVAPLLAQGNGATAQVLRSDLTAALRRNFADRVAGRSPALVVQIRSLSLNPYVGSGGGGRGLAGGGTQNDYLDGVALLVAPDGRVLARHPQLAVLPSSSGGAWYDPASERRRIAAIADQYAQWLRRDLAPE